MIPGSLPSSTQTCRSTVLSNQVAARIRGTTQYVFQGFSNAIGLEGNEAQFLR